MVKIAVIGAGVNGMGCAIKIKEKYPDFEVVVLSKDFTPNTTGDGSAGLWYPYLCGDTPQNKLIKWGIETFKFMHSCWLEGAEGVCVLPVYALHRTGSENPPEWGKKVFGFHELSEKALKDLSLELSVPFSYGITFVTFTFEPSKLLPILMKRFETIGGVVQKHEVKTLKDSILDEFDVVINCTGLQAKSVTPDNGVFPIRGQVCKHCMKSVEKHWAGLRPGRHVVRLEAEEIGPKLIIHNYGHGGSGVTLFWGCASEVVQILQNYVPKLNHRQISSKL